MAATPLLPLLPGQPVFRRRTLLAASAAGIALVVTGCTSSPPPDARERVTSEQADLLAAQVTVQESLVAAVGTATAADPALAAAVPDLITQTQEQLTRLRAAAPGATASAGAAPPAPPAGAEVRAWLRGQVSEAAASHAAACAGQSGARAALLGSLSAGLRGHEARLA
jgi:hypothetical protein